MKNFILYLFVISFTFSTSLMAQRGSIGGEEPTRSGSIEFIEFNEQDLPRSISYDGNIVVGKAWTDKNGTNYMLLTRTKNKVKEAEDDYGLDEITAYVYGYHFVWSKAESKYVVKRKITDFSKKCGFDIVAMHVPESLSVTDLDNDGFAEITFVYRVGCRSDVSPVTQKLMLLEDGEKYPLRGQTEVMRMGGDYKVGKEFGDAPDAFLQYAKGVWDANKTEFE